MPNNAHFSLDAGIITSSSYAISPERRLWFAAAERLLFDYALLTRESWIKKLTAKKKGALDRAREAIFKDDGALFDILISLVDEPDYLLKKMREAVSDDNIRTDTVLSRKLRQREAIA